MELFEKAKLWKEDRKPFALFRKPGQTTVTGMFQRQRVSHGCQKCNVSGFVFAPFDSGTMWYLPEDESDVEISDYFPDHFETPTPELEIDTKAKSDFIALVSKAKDAIASNLFEKVVLSRTENVALQDFDVFEAFAKLASAYPQAYVYLWFHPETDVWLAATPEKLLEANAERFSTMALAGTQKFQGEMNVDWPKKEREEQRFVTDYIWDSLESVSSELELGAPYTFRAGNLLHIRTDINGQLTADNDVAGLIDVLHPTPAVCGLPKEQAMAFILANEGYDRSFYTGFVGQLNLTTGTDLYVNLRCMNVIGNHARLFVGCGITKDSDPEKEFFETVNKSLTIRRCL